MVRREELVAMGSFLVPSLSGCDVEEEGSEEWLSRRAGGRLLCSGGGGRGGEEQLWCGALW